MRRRIASLLSDAEGATIVEFALILPVLMVTLMGLFDLSYNMYTSQMLQGAIQNAARSSTIEGASGDQAGIDGIVTRAVHAISPAATLQFDRRAYASFADVARPEDFTDVNGNGSCDNGEPFEDVNANGSWDADRAAAGFGGARDAVLYSVTVNYPRPFPIAKFIPGQTSDFTLRTQTVLRNQPYGAQEKGAPSMGNCS
ncbi:MAG TPA: pilus assembly protein [Novosphingobium sp.]|nr:pilus assembly protein [Novosphingobium sp.]